MKSRLVILFLIASVAVSNVLAATVQNDSIYLVSAPDTVKVVETEEYVSKSTFQPDAQKSVWLAAVVPGLGQIYNRQYWKVPIIYGGALGLAYGITWNDRMYVDYRKGYVDLMDKDPSSNYYEYLLPEGVVLDNSNKDYYTRVIKTKLDNYRRNRDLCIIASAVFYLLTIIDAYVDAQMFDYDISSDLSLEVVPTVIAPSATHEQESSVGLSCKLKF
ncbi:MAG: DUF5683 domain-containing protein [Paludibacteraceae bacterium]|nr:DUF5683 domain-containing protein [Paludibacteraceae bacterium]